MKSKIESYIGFAIKKGSVVFGCDSIERYKKKIFVLLETQSLSPNSRKVMEKCSVKFDCKLFEIEDFDFFKNKNCKALAICDKSLADAIVKVKEAEDKNGEHIN